MWTYGTDSSDNSAMPVWKEAAGRTLPVIVSLQPHWGNANGREQQPMMENTLHICIYFMIKSHISTQKVRFRLLGAE